MNSPKKSWKISRNSRRPLAFPCKQSLAPARPYVNIAHAAGMAAEGGSNDGAPVSPGEKR